MNENNATSVSHATEIRFGGVGGQGIVLAGRLLGKAASLFDDKDAVVTQSYGPEARGGASRADVVISDDSVDYPFVTKADVLAVFFQEAYVMFRPTLKEGGLLLADDTLVQPFEEEQHLHSVPATRIAEDLGTRMAANVVMLGYLVGATGIVSRDSIEQAIRSTVKAKVIDLNLKALDSGMKLALEHAAA
jgi:2-oxoglutarate ferredoxin oxidoreductase subunit gamma